MVGANAERNNESRSDDHRALNAGTPANGTTGNYTVTITATNSIGSTSQTFHLTVTAH